MGFLNDTSIWIAVERGQLAPADVHAVTGTEPLFLSPVNVAEMQAGAELIEDLQHRARCLAALRRLKRKPQLRITVETGEVFGHLAAELKKAGRAEDFRVQDVWLAAQAIQRSFKLLTVNEKDFRDIPGLDLVVMPLPHTPQPRSG
jgi:predicted nucleic acid-binding protein